MTKGPLRLVAAVGLALGIAGAVVLLSPRGAPGLAPPDAAPSDAAGFREGPYISTRYGEQIPSECIWKVPVGSTIGPDHVATLRDGTKLYPPPPCPYLAPGGERERLVREHGEKFVAPGLNPEADFTQGQLPYGFAVQNPYDGALNLFQDAGAFDAAIPWLEAPIWDAGYAFFTQVLGWFVAPPLPPSGATVTIWPSIGGTTGNESTAGVAGGSNLLQPLLYRSATSGPWQLVFRYCCDAYAVEAFLSDALPGDTITMNIQIDSRFPCPSNGLGCYYLESINDTGEGGAPDANFGDNYLSIFLPPIEGPQYVFAWSVETFGGTSCNDLPGGTGHSATWNSLAMYESAITDAGATTDANTVTTATLPLIPHFINPPLQGTYQEQQTGSAPYFGYLIGSGLSGNAYTRAGVWDSTVYWTFCNNWPGCTCDAGVLGNQFFLSW